MAGLERGLRERLIADYARRGNYRAVAREHGVSASTVRRAVEAAGGGNRPPEDPADVGAYIAAQRPAACRLIGLFLQELQDPARLERASVNQLSSALGTLMDKFGANAREPGLVVEHFIPEEQHEDGDG